MKFVMIEFRGEEALWAKIAAAAAPFGSLDFGDPASAAAIAARELREARHAARVAADLVVFAEEALHRAKAQE